MNLVAHDIIIRPVVTEKSSRMMEMNKYTFEVHPMANKVEIRKAVEVVFKVKVKSVHTIKKAVITLADGEHIQFFEGAGA